VPSSGRPAPNVTGEHGPLYPSAILLHPSGRLAYVTFSYVTTECADDTLIYVYAVDPASGMLTKLGLAPQSVGQGWGAASVVLSASGARLYSASGGDFENNVCTVAPGMRGFAVDAGSGELRELAGSPFAQGTRDDGYSWLGLRPTGDFLYLAHQSGTSWFKVNAATGAVMNQGMASYSLPGVAAFSPSGRLYSAAAESLTWGVRAFDVQPDTGALSPIRGAPFATPSYVKAIAIDSTGRFLFAAQPWGGVISAFAIDAGTGSLTPVPGSPAAMGTELSDDVAIVIVNVP
jgi:6-phosphogluconolactonase (cycloisomerase 2 family)